MIDLDKAKAARREAGGKGPEVTVGGKVYELSPEMPYAAIECLRGLEDKDTAASALVDLVQALLGEHHDEIKKSLSMDDVNELIGEIMAEYGVDDPLPSTVS